MLEIWHKKQNKIIFLNRRDYPGDLFLCGDDFLHKLNDFISVRDDVTMIDIDDIYKTKDVMGNVLEEISKLNIDAELVDYHINYKGSKVTMLVENSGILRTISAAGMFKDKLGTAMCDVYCSNSAVSVSLKISPIDAAAKIIKEFEKNDIELYHLFSGDGFIIVVINEAYTDEVCTLCEKLFL